MWSIFGENNWQLELLGLTTPVLTMKKIYISLHIVRRHAGFGSVLQQHTFSKYTPIFFTPNIRSSLCVYKICKNAKVCMQILWFLLQCSENVTMFYFPNASQKTPRTTDDDDYFRQPQKSPPMIPLNIKHFNYANTRTKTRNSIKTACTRRHFHGSATPLYSPALLKRPTHIIVIL